MPSPADAAIPDGDLQTPDELTALLGQLHAAAPAPIEFGANLAEHMDESDLNTIGDTIVDMVEADEESRTDWKQRFERGLEVLGIKDFVWKSGKAPFEGASTVVHPMLIEALTQYQARAMEELFPAAGPVKSLVMGVEDRPKREAADRVQDHMNYQLTLEDPEYFLETNKLHWYLPLYGTVYRKGYHDPILDRNVLRFVTAEDLVLPYSAGSMATARRKTHKFDLSDNDLKKYQAAKVYLDIEIEDPGESPDDDEKKQTDEVDDLNESEHADDVTFEMLETDIEYDIPGFEDPNGIALPYTITVERSSRKVLAIYRNWKEKDPLKKARVRYAEYWFLPGFGVYGFGLLHTIGSLAEATTDNLRALLDSATFANVQGGFKAKDANVKGGETHLRPGVWQDVDMTAEELSKAFYTPPFKEPSAALFQLLGLLQELGRRFAATTDLMVGQADNKAPVGTTIALIEQGQKVYSGVHRRGHNAAGVEFRILFDLNSEYIPDEGYPYKVPGDDKQVFAADYDETMISIVPVSDPNIASQTQRIAQNQALMQMSASDPSSFKKYEVNRRMLEALKIPAIDDVLIDTDSVPMMDPVTENIAMLNNRPVKAKDNEDHLQHLSVHTSFLQHPQFGGQQDVQKMIGPAMMAHMAEHLSLQYAHANRASGVPVPPINLSAGPGESIAPPEAEQFAPQITAAASQAIAAFMQQQGFVPPSQTAPDPMAAAQVRKVDAEAFSAMGTGAAGFAKAGATVVAAEADLAGLDQALQNPPQPQDPNAPPGAPAGPGGPTPPPDPNAPPQPPSPDQGAPPSSPMPPPMPTPQGGP